jgi:hypothetical protein
MDLVIHLLLGLGIIFNSIGILSISKQIMLLSEELRGDRTSQDSPEEKPQPEPEFNYQLLAKRIYRILVNAEVPSMSMTGLLLSFEGNYTKDEIQTAVELTDGLDFEDFSGEVYRVDRVTKP